MKNIFFKKINSESLNISKLITKGLAWTICISLLVNCSKNDDSGGGAGSPAAPIPDYPKPAEVIPDDPTPAWVNNEQTQKDFSQLNEMVLNYSLPFASKKILASMVIDKIAKTNNVKKSEVIYQLQKSMGFSDNENVLAMEQLQEELKKARQSIRFENGFPFAKDEQGAEVYYLGTSEAVTNLIKNESELSTFHKAQIRKAETDTYVVFKALDFTADTAAKVLLSKSLKSLSANEMEQLKSVKDMDDKQGPIVAAAILQKAVERSNIQIPNPSQSETKNLQTMTAFKLGQVACKELKTDLLEGTLKFQVNDADLKDAATNLSKVVSTFAEYSNSMDEKWKELSSSFKNISTELDKFSQDGMVKIQNNALKISPEVKAQTEKAAKTMSEIINGAGTLIKLAEKFGVKSKELENAKKLVATGVAVKNVIQAAMSGNPLQMAGAALNLFNVGNSFGETIDPAEARHQEIMERMDQMIGLQKVTIEQLKNVQNSLKDIQEMQVLQLKALSALSEQIASSTTVIYNQINKVLVDTDLIKSFLSLEAKSKFASCSSLPEIKFYQEKKSKLARKDSDEGALLLKESISQNSSYDLLEGSYNFVNEVANCNAELSRIDINNPSTMTPFLLTNSPEYQRHLARLLKLGDTRVIARHHKFQLFNPVSNFFNLEKIINFNYDYNLSFTNGFNHLSENFSYDPASVVNTAAIFSSANGSLILLNSKSQNSDPYNSFTQMSQKRVNKDTRNFYTRLIELVEMSIIQESFLSGANTINDMIYTPGTVSKMSETGYNCANPNETPHINCVLEGNELFRKNFAIAGFQKAKKQTGMNYSLLKVLPVDQKKSIFKSAFGPEWVFNDGNTDIQIKLGTQFYPIPSDDEIEQGNILYSENMTALLALREKLVAQLAEAQVVASIKDDKVKKALLFEALNF